jgi:hypothetical protein
MAPEDACACQKYGDPGPTIIRVAGGFPEVLTMTLTTAISAPAQIVNGDASMPAIGAEVVQ